MPQVIPVVIYYVAQYLGASALVAAALAAAASYAVSEHQRQKAKRQARDAYNAALSDRLVMTAVNDGPRSRIYGKVRNVDGVLFKATRGTNSEIYTLVVALAGHQVEAIDRIYFNDLEVSLDGSGRVQTAPYLKNDSANRYHTLALSHGAGSYTITTGILSGSVRVITGPGGEGLQYDVPFTLSGSLVTIAWGVDYTGNVVIQWQEPTGASYAKVTKYLGSPSQDISAEMVSRFPGYCTSSDKFSGIALLLVDLEYSPDAFPTGVPNITAEIRGARVFDPRTSTTAYSENPALIARDWVRYTYGGGLAYAQVRDADVMAAATACEVNLAFTTPLGGTVTQDAYACGIVCQSGADPSTWLGEIVESMAGKWGFSGGQLRMVAGSYRTPVATLTGDWVSDFDDIQIVPSLARDEVFNSVRMTIADAAQNYIMVQMPRVAPGTYIADDGEELTSEITSSGITSAVRSQYVSSVLLREGRQSLSVRLPCKMHAWALELFDNVWLTIPAFGWSAKVFEVEGWEYKQGAGVLLALRETASSVYTIDASYEDLGYDDNTRLPDPWQTEPVLGFALDSGSDQAVVQGDGSFQPRVLATWDALTLRASLYGNVEIRYGNGLLPESEWKTMSVPGDRTSAYLTTVVDKEVVIAKARSVTRLNAGPWCAQKSVFVEGRDGLADESVTVTVRAYDAAGVAFNNIP